MAKLCFAAKVIELADEVCEDLIGLLAGDVNIPDSVGRIGQNCADEPIRVPGSIQRQGFLLLLDLVHLR